MPIDGGKIMSYLELDTSGYQDAMASAHNMMLTLQDSSIGLGAKMDSLGTLFQQAGSKLTMGLTVPLAAAGGAAAKAAIDFESAFAGVRKTVDATEAEYAALADGIKAMSREIPQSANELAGIAEIAGQLGVDQGNLLSFTETIANLGVSTNLTGEAAATMLAQYANIMQMPLSDIGRLGSVIVDLGNHCATTEADITEMAQRLAGTGSLLGLTNAQVMGLSATMASLGVNAEAGGSAMSRTLQTMQSAVLAGGAELDSFAAIAGATAQDFAQAFRADPMQALEDFLTGLGRINAAGGDAAGALEEVSLSDLRITDTLLRMASAQGSLTENIGMASAAWDENNALQTEASKRYETTESKLQLAKNSVVNMAASLGDLLLPLVSQGADLIGKAADGLNNMNDGTKKIIVTAGGLLALAGPLTSTLGTVIKLVSSPVGLTVALGLAGVAGVNAFRGMQRAAQEARLEERFGDITLSAEEMAETVEALLGQDLTERAQLAVIMDDAQAELDQAIADFEQQELSTKKMFIQADMGVKIPYSQLWQEAAKTAQAARGVIEQKKVNANMTIDAVFGADDPEGAKLKERVLSYLDKADGKVLEKGTELTKLLEKGMRQGFLDPVDQETVNALLAEMDELYATVTATNEKAELLRFEVEAKNSDLSLESLRALDEEYKKTTASLIEHERQYGEQAKNVIYEAAAWGEESADTVAAKIEAIDQRTEHNVAAAEGEAYMGWWRGIGSRFVVGFEEEMTAAAPILSEVMDKALEGAAKNGDYSSWSLGQLVTDWLGADTSAGSWWDVATPEVQSDIGNIYETYLQEKHQELRQLAAAMGDGVTEEMRQALSTLDLMELMTLNKLQVGAMVGESMAQGAEAAKSGAQQVADSSTEPLEGVEEEFSELGGNAGQGYTEGLSAYKDTAWQAAYDTLSGSVDGGAEAIDSHSPSRKFMQLGRWALQGFVLELDAGQSRAYLSGYNLARAAVRGMQAGQDSHSPSKATAKLGEWNVQGYNNALKRGTQLIRATSTQLARTSVDAMSKAQKEAYLANAANGVLGDGATEDTASTKKGGSSKGSSKSNKAAAERARQEAEAAEEARRQATLAGISRTAQATLAADTAAFDKRMGQLARQTQELMDFAGAHAIWYQDSKGDTQVQEVKERYDALIDQEKKRYEAQAAGLTDDEQKKAAKEAYEERTALLKKQRDEETAALKEQYSLQKEMAADWLNSQKSLLQEAMDAKRAAYQEEDYQDELSDLKKRQRQSKSAREKRELQEQIDKMIRDHALEQEEAAMQETLAGYDALIEAVQAGLIGLGDLTGNAAMGDLAFGTAGLTALDNITSAQMEAVLRSLSRDSLAGGTAQAVSAAQMAAALASAGQKSSVPAAQTQGGNTYNINLSGAVVRDDSDVTRIVEELERRIRQAGR